VRQDHQPFGKGMIFPYFFHINLTDIQEISGDLMLHTGIMMDYVDDQLEHVGASKRVIHLTMIFALQGLDIHCLGLDISTGHFPGSFAAMFA